MGGDGSEAHAGGGNGVGRVRSTLNLCCSKSDLCLLKDGKEGEGAIPCEYCMDSEA